MSWSPIKFFLNLLWLLSFPIWGGSTTIEVVVLDPEGFGFNDPGDPVDALDNTGLSLGEQRVNVVQRAGEIWAAYLQSEVPIRVQCKFEDLGGTPEGYPLAGASAISVWRDFSGAPLPGVWYPVALANSLAGEDLSTGDDIMVTVNIAPDDDPALAPWYYGLDGNAPPGTTDLLDVLLHEIGHGLGFSSFSDIQSGSFLQRIPDIYSLHLYDTELGSGWGDLGKRDRQLSAVNDPDLTWSGPYTTAGASQMLEQRKGIIVAEPHPNAGEYFYEPATFGPAVLEGGISGPLVIVNDGIDPGTDACSAIENAGELINAIAYIDRGSCNFDSKVLQAQLAGAVAVIIANNEPGGPVLMSGSDVVEGVPLIIPAVSISQEDGVILASVPGIQMTIGIPTSELAGTTGGNLRVYAPDPVEQGSSVSHWSPDASPDLLMEPFINQDLRQDLDLSLTLMKDIGWTVIEIPFPHLTYPLWVAEAFSEADLMTDPGDDPDFDGVLNIEEYFFGGDPRESSPEVLPRMLEGEAGNEFGYTRATLFTDLSWEYEISSDLLTWTTAQEGIDYTEEISTPVGVAAEQVRLKLVGPAPGGKVFVRLRILPQ